MAIDPTKVLGKGQIYYGKDETPRVLKIGDGATAVGSLPNIIDMSQLTQEALEALTGEDIKVSSAADAKTIAQAIADLQALASGARMGIVFADQDQMAAWIAGTYTRPDAQVVADLVIGQNIFLEAIDQPDYWWNGTAAVELETAKVDLTDYYNKTEADSAISTAIGNAITSLTTTLAGYYTKTETDTAISNAITAAINALPAYARTAPANDGAPYIVRNGAWEKAVVEAADLA